MQNLRQSKPASWPISSQQNNIGMVINLTYKYELKPNNKQRALLIKYVGVARFAWNWGLARRKMEYKETGKSSNSIKQHRELNALKKTEFPWMYEVSKCVPQGALRNLDRAYANFFRGIRNKKNVGLPRFKKKGKNDSFVLYGGFNTLRVKDKTVRLPRIGVVRTKETTNKLKGRILNATVSRETDRWFVSLQVEHEHNRTMPIQNNVAIGIDLGINSFATIWDGSKTEYIDAPKPLAKKLARLRILDSQRSRKQKNSQNYKKASLASAKQHRKIRNIRKDFLAKLSSSLARTKSVIVIEDLNVQGLLHNHNLARSIMDCSWGNFRQMLEYKTRWYGSKLIIIGRFEPTSKLCSKCGATNNTLSLDNRNWVCLSCNSVHDRDENAAKNIRQLGLAILDTEGSSGINACGEESSGSSSNVRTKLFSVKQEVSALTQDIVSGKAY